MKKSLLALPVLFAAMGCIPQQFSGTESGTRAASDIPDPDTVICDPFDAGGNNGSQIHGLSGSLFYLTPEQPRYETAREYIQNGQALDDFVVYMNQLYVPTRAFDRGFITESGATLRTPAGDTLYEYFALRLESTLKLATGDSEGQYQLAVLSDDGAILSLGTQAGGYVDFINNDNVHPTRMACATTPVNFAQNSRIPMRLDYFQGPRFHISMILMWRPFPSNPADVQDPLCGHTSNEDFFDSTVNPSSMAWAYNQLLSRGWRPLQPHNFLLQEGINPCNEDR